MTEPASAPLKKTALHATHVALGARMVPFAGWEMPVEYSGITAEHLAVRSGAGLFDVSHMGEIEIAGKDALAVVQHISSNDASRLQVNQAHYAALTTPEGTFVDDMLVYRFAPSHFLLVVNSSNVDKDYAWIGEHAKKAGDAAIVNSTSVRQRHRRHDDSARSGSELGHRLEEGSVCRPVRATTAERQRCDS
jgi:aminomethyltransferase